MKSSFFSLIAAALTVGVMACNNDGDGNASTDTTGAAVDDNTTAASGTVNNNASTQDYSALADTFRMNSEQGNYLDPVTGKSMRISVDSATGRRMNAETGEPVWRYVDKRTWWVYSGDESKWDTVGSARMEKNKLMYRGDNEKWVDYNARWKSEDERMMSDWKKKYGDTKVKMSKDGDIKVKNEDGKIKYDADDNKVKTDTSN